MNNTRKAPEALMTNVNRGYNATMAHRRFQFSLQTLFWLTLVAAAFFGGMATQRWRARREFEATYGQPVVDFGDPTLGPLP